MNRVIVMICLWFGIISIGVSVMSDEIYTDSGSISGNTVDTSTVTTTILFEEMY